MKKIITTFGITEKEIHEILSDISNRFKTVTLNIVSKIPEIHVVLDIRDDEDDGQLLHDCMHWIKSHLDYQVVSTEGMPLETVVGDLLRKRKVTVAVAESCTGGLIAHQLTNVAGSSEFFLLSTVVYSNQAKQNVIGVSQKTLERYGAVHEKTAQEMAAGVMRLAEADIGLSTTGIAGPGGGTDSKPVGTVCIGLSTTNTVKGKRFFYSDGNRLIKKKYFAATALNSLRILLIEGRYFNK